MADPQRVLIGRFQNSSSQEILEIYNDSLVVLSKAGQQVHSWNELTGYIEAVAEVPRRSLFKSRLETNYNLTLQFEDGQSYSVDNGYSNIAQLAKVLVSVTYFPLWSKANRELQAGRAVHFGPFTITQRQLEVNSEILPWKQVIGVGTEDHKVVITVFDANGKAYPFATQPEREVTNTVVFVELARKLAAYARSNA